MLRPYLMKMREAYTAHFIRAFKQAPWRTQTQAVAAWSMILLAMAVIGGLYLAVASRAGTAGRDLQQFEARRTELIQANDELRAKLAELRSVTRMANRARELGFLPAQAGQIEYLAVNDYPALVVQAPPPAQTADSEVTTVASQGWLAEVLQSLVPGSGSGG